MSKGEGRTIATDSAGPGGKTLAGGFSPRLCRRLTECVAAMTALEKIASPIVPYIAAWREHEKIIWYSANQLSSESALTTIGMRILVEVPVASMPKPASTSDSSSVTSSA